MTNELEKRFFDTFGIGTYYKYLLIDKTSRFYNEKLLDKTNFIDFVKSGKGYLLLKVIKYYPQITSDILLELICICSQYGFCPTARNVKDLKLKVLKRLFKLKNNLKNNYEHQGCHNAFVRKVRTLFEEG